MRHMGLAIDRSAFDFELQEVWLDKKRSPNHSERRIYDDEVPRATRADIERFKNRNFGIHQAVDAEQMNEFFNERFNEWAR